METTLSAAGVVRGADGARWSLRGSGLGETRMRGALPGTAHGTTLLQCVIDRGDGQAAVRGWTLILTVHRGDRLRARFEGTVTPPDPDGFIDLCGELTITGGTGCFEGAAGGGPVTGTLDTARRTFCLTGRVRAALDPAGPGLFDSLPFRG